MEATDIIDRIRTTISNGGIVAPGEWLEMAFSLNALIGKENDSYASLYRKAHIIQLQAIQEGGSVGLGEAEMKASNTYEQLLAQKGKVEQIMEFIRIAKIRGSQADKEYNLDA